MPYPPSPQLAPLPEFRGTARSGVNADPHLIAFVVAQYAAGRSLRQIAELTDRTHSAVRNILDRAGVARRGPGAPLIRPLEPDMTTSAIRTSSR